MEMSEYGPETNNLDLREIDLNSVQLLSRETCEKHLAVVLEVPAPGEDEPITVGMVHPDLKYHRQAIKNELKSPIRAVKLEPAQLRQIMSRAYDLQGDVREAIPSLQVLPDHDLNLGRDPDVNKLLQGILSRAIRDGASDVHFETYRDKVRVRLRTDGVLRSLDAPLDKSNYRQLISKLKVMADVDVIERRKDQDGRFSVEYIDENRDGRRINFRLATLPRPTDEDITLRILDPKNLELGLGNLGFDTHHESTLRQFIEEPSGMLLVVGPTGSGKTQTLYAALQHIRDQEQKILTAENPIEYPMEGLNQAQVNKDMGFADYTRAFLRQDPDVIVIGEIRDPETAEVSFRAAYTGHLVLSTLHASDAVKAVTRLRTLGVENDYIGDTLLGILSQRLIRVLCPGCKQPTPPDEDKVKRFFKTVPDFDFYEAEGCETCEWTGYRGRTGVFELLQVTEGLRSLISTGAPSEKIQEEARAAEHHRIHEHVGQKLMQGETSLDEAIRQIEAPGEEQRI